MIVREKLEERTELHARVTLMDQERERHKRLKKDLPPEKLSELANLRHVRTFLRFLGIFS